MKPSYVFRILELHKLIKLIIGAIYKGRRALSGEGVALFLKEVSRNKVDGMTWGYVSPRASLSHPSVTLCELESNASSVV